MTMRTALITGIQGQDGSLLAEFLLNQGYRVVGTVKPGSEQHGKWRVPSTPELRVIEWNLQDDAGFQRAISEHKPQEIYNLAARASSRHLFSDPVLTGDCNGLAVTRILEAIRLIDSSIRMCQASSSELFGNTKQSPQSERTPFQPRNPYGVAKRYAHEMVQLYRNTFGIFACSAILFNHESSRRTMDFVTRKISVGAARIALGLQEYLELDSLDAARDWGYAGDYVRAMWLMLQANHADDYVVSTGEIHTVGEFCEVAFARVGLDYRKYVKISAKVDRPQESVRLVGDPTKIRSILNWTSLVSFVELVNIMVDADLAKLSGDTASAVR